MSPGDIRGGRGDIRGGRGDIRVEDPENHILLFTALILNAHLIFFFIYKYVRWDSKESQPCVRC